MEQFQDAVSTVLDAVAVLMFAAGVVVLIGGVWSWRLGLGMAVGGVVIFVADSVIDWAAERLATSVEDGGG